MLTQPSKILVSARSGLGGVSTNSLADHTLGVIDVGFFLCKHRLLPSLISPKRLREKVLVDVTLAVRLGCNPLSGLQRLLTGLVG